MLTHSMEESTKLQEISWTKSALNILPRSKNTAKTINKAKMIAKWSIENILMVLFFNRQENNMIIVIIINKNKILLMIDFRKYPAAHCWMAYPWKKVKIFVRAKE